MIVREYVTHQDSTLDYSDGEVMVFIDFTYDEELYFATSVLDNLTQVWLGMDDATAFERIFTLKAKRGSAIPSDDFVWYMEWMDRNNRTIPHFELRDDGDDNAKKSIRDFLKAGESSTELSSRIRAEIRRAWKEAWEMHPTIRRKGFEFFPADNYEDSLPNGSALRKEIIDAQFRKEHMFWEEVDKVQSQVGCPRNEAIVIVGDYKPRGKLPENQIILDPNKNNSYVPQDSLPSNMELT